MDGLEEIVDIDYNVPPPVNTGAGINDYLLSSRFKNGVGGGAKPRPSTMDDLTNLSRELKEHIAPGSGAGPSRDASSMSVQIPNGTNTNANANANTNANAGGFLSTIGNFFGGVATDPAEAASSTGPSSTGPSSAGQLKVEWDRAGLGEPAATQDYSMPPPLYSAPAPPPRADYGQGGSGSGSGGDRALRAKKKAKRQMLRDLQQLAAINPDRFRVTVTEESSIDDIEDELEIFNEEYDQQNGLDMIRDTFRGTVTAIEQINQYANPFDLKLTGLSDAVGENISTYEYMFIKLQRQYRNLSVPVPVQIIFHLCMTVAGIHVSNRVMDELCNNGTFMQGVLSDPGVRSAVRNASMSAVNAVAAGFGPTPPNMPPNMHPNQPPPAAPGNFAGLMPQGPPPPPAVRTNNRPEPGNVPPPGTGARAAPQYDPNDLEGRGGGGRGGVFVPPMSMPSASNASGVAVTGRNAVVAPGPMLMQTPGVSLNAPVRVGGDKPVQRPEIKPPSTAAPPSAPPASAPPSAPSAPSANVDFLVANLKPRASGTSEPKAPPMPEPKAPTMPEPKALPMPEPKAPTMSEVNLDFEVETVVSVESTMDNAAPRQRRSRSGRQSASAVMRVDI